MKTFLIILLCASVFRGRCQEEPEPDEREIETIVENPAFDEDNIIDLDIAKHSININTAGINELKEISFLSDIQIIQLITYRKLLGAFIDIHELQAIPLWDIETIQKVLPFINLNNTVPLVENLSKRFRNGKSQLLIRFSEVLQKSKGFTDTSAVSGYLGSRPALSVKWKYNYKGNLQYGITADKDAGEPLFKDAQRMGFDFYSLHLFARKINSISAMAIGDFTVNMGQGLVNWQSLAFKKGGNVTDIKRQSETIKPHTGAGEFLFYRGAAISIQKKQWRASGFVSLRKLSASISIDSTANSEYISTLSQSGNHRTKSEQSKRNNLSLAGAGINLCYFRERWRLGLNSVFNSFSIPFKPSAEPYDVFSIAGKRLLNVSADYELTHKNVHLFGEVGSDINGNVAAVNGLVMSLHHHVDVSLLHRQIPKDYASFFTNAFTENSTPINENGLYIGIAIKPLRSWRIETYFDYYKFPWLKFRADAPSHGRDVLFQISYSPSKRFEIYSRFRSEVRAQNYDGIYYYILEESKTAHWRNHIAISLNRGWTIRNRLEFSWFRQSRKRGEGFLAYTTIIYSPPLSSSSLNTRLQYFETSGFNTRIYAYENDVLYGSSIPAFSGKGFRWYINGRTNVSNFFPHYTPRWKAHVSLKYGLTKFKNAGKIGSGTDEIPGNLRSEVKFQLLFSTR